MEEDVDAPAEVDAPSGVNAAVRVDREHFPEPVFVAPQVEQGPSPAAAVNGPSHLPEVQGPSRTVGVDRPPRSTSFEEPPHTAAINGAPRNAGLDEPPRDKPPRLQAPSAVARRSLSVNIIDSGTSCSLPNTYKVGKVGL